MAPIGHIVIQVPHLIHLSVSIKCFSLSSPDIHSAGQFLAHLVHPIHLSVISKVNKDLHTKAGQCLSLTWARYSSGKYRMLLKTGFGAVCPRPQSEIFLMVSANSFKESKSSSVPSLVYF